MAWFRIPLEDDLADDAGDLDAPDFFAVGTNPGTPVAAAETTALGSGPTELSCHLLRAHLSALAARNGLEVLEVEEDDDEACVREAYRQLCERWHPAKFANAEDEVRELVAEIAIQIEHAYREVAALAEASAAEALDGDAEADLDEEPAAEAVAAHRQEARRSLARARDAMQRGEIYAAATEFERTLELAPASREAAAGLELIGELKRAAHRGAMQRILTRGRS